MLFFHGGIRSAAAAGRHLLQPGGLRPQGATEGAGGAVPDVLPEHLPVPGPRGHLSGDIRHRVDPDPVPVRGGHARTDHRPHMGHIYI